MRGREGALGVGGGGLAPAAAAAKGKMGGGGGNAAGKVPDGVRAALAQKSWVRSANKERMFCWAPKKRGEGAKILLLKLV